MTSTHLTGRHGRPRPRVHVGPSLGMVSMFAAAAATGWLLALDNDERRTMSLQSPPPAKVAPPQQIQLSGTVTAVSRDSLTATAADGQVTTFRLTPETNRLATSFAPAQRIVVVGVVHAGVPVATAIANQSAIGAHGPPMDYGLPA